MRSDADDRRGDAGPADGGGRARAALFRQIYPGYSLTEAKASRQIESPITERGRRSNMSTSLQEVAPLKSGAAGAAQFVGSESRKYNYFEPKGRKATHYEDMTVDVQPDPKRYLLQDWILAFADGTPTYSENWTAAKSTDWHKFRAIDEEWERTHYQRQSTIVGMITGAVNNARRSGAVKRFDKTWVKVLE